MSDLIDSAAARSSGRPVARPRPSARIGKADRTRAAILDAALEFLWSHPFREMTVASLMESAGASRPAFYRYFHDLHDLMEVLLVDLESEILEAAAPWFTGSGDPVELVRVSLGGLVRVCYQRGPIIRAVADAAPHDERMERSWAAFLSRFDDVVATRIEADQRHGLIPAFAARPVAMALNRLDAFTLIDTFGKRPRGQPGPVLEAITRIWIAALYGQTRTRKRRP